MKPSPATTFGAFGLGGLALTIAIHHPAIAVWVFGLILALSLAIESTREARMRRGWQRAVKDFRAKTERPPTAGPYFVPDPSKKPN